MVRLLLLLAILVVVALLLRRAVAAMRKPGEAHRDATGPSQGTEAKLVRCTQCGAFVPKADTVPVDDGYRCAAGCQPR
jgi:hypothetical protein